MALQWKSAIRECYAKYIVIKFRPFNQYFVEAHLAVITASSLLGYDTTSLAHLYLYPSPCHWKIPPQQDTATTMLHRRDYARFPPDVTLGIQAKVLNLGFKRPENLVSYGLRVL